MHIDVNSLRRQFRVFDIQHRHTHTPHKNHTPTPLNSVTPNIFSFTLVTPRNTMARRHICVRSSPIAPLYRMSSAPLIPRTFRHGAVENRMLGRSIWGFCDSLDSRRWILSCQMLGNDLMPRADYRKVIWHVGRGG